MKTLPVLVVFALSGCGTSIERRADEAQTPWQGVSTRSQMCEVLHSDLASIYQGFDEVQEPNQSYLLGGSGVGNGGDPLRVIFERARGDAAKRVRAFKSCELPADTAAKVIDWLDMHRVELEQDIRNSQHVWLEKPQATCARTLLARDMPITLSFEICRQAEVDQSVAAELLVHESVHHFGIEDETEADKIAHAVMTRGEGSCRDDSDDSDGSQDEDDRDGDQNRRGRQGGGSGGSSASASGDGGAAAACAGGNGSAAAASGGGAVAVSCSGGGSSAASASSGGASASSSSGGATTTTTTTTTSTAPAAYFGSIAYSPSSGKTGLSWLQPSIDTAKTQAVAQCDEGDCDSVVWVRSGCAALVVSEGSNSSYKWGWSSDRATAVSLATEACEAAFTSCKAPTSVCSG